MKGQKETHSSHHTKGESHIDLKSPMFHGIIKGTLPWFVLTQLRDGSLYGNEIIRSMSEKSGHTYKPSPGSVYPILHRYEEEGLISGDWKRGTKAAKRVYKLTRKGRAALPGIQKKMIDEMKVAVHVLEMHIKALEKESE